jgi:EAL domain-containing protein (putative c-di-GMP-specific phosphodiesterase class I)
VRSKYSNILILVAAVLSFLPALGAGYVVDGYARARMTVSLQRAADAIGADIEANADEAIASLQTVLADSPSLCTPTFVANVHKAIQSSLHLKDIVVENAAGMQYCDGFGVIVGYVPLSADLAIPGHPETVTVVRLSGLDLPVLKIARTYGAERRISAFVPILSSPAQTLQTASGGLVRLQLTNGTNILGLGDEQAYDHRRSDADFISVQSLAGEIPLRAEIDMPTGVAVADYANLRVGLVIFAGLLSAALLIALLQYVRRSTLPAFNLERAIAMGEIRPFYQPVIDLNNGRLLGCEVLARWVRKNGTMVPPGSFIDYAEATNLAIPMTVSLMQQVRDDLSDLCRDMPTLKVSINLFEGHFRDSTIVDDVQAIFGGSPINFSQLTFEITERRPLGNSGQAHSVIAGLHALGARLALDDVGTGHSNLAYLQTLGVDILKIDHVFVDMVKEQTAQVPVLDGLILMARDLGTEVVAEGVETEAQAFYLRARGVFQAQGFLFAPALKLDSFKLLAYALNAPGPVAVAAEAEAKAA